MEEGAHFVYMKPHVDAMTRHRLQWAFLNASSDGAAGDPWRPHEKFVQSIRRNWMFPWLSDSHRISVACSSSKIEKIEPESYVHR